MQATAFLATGDNPTRVFGLTAAERARRFAIKSGLAPAAGPADGPMVIANLAFAFDPAWMRFLSTNPGRVVTLGGVPALASTGDRATAERIAAAMTSGARLPAGLPLTEQRAEEGASFYNHELRKRENAYLAPLTPGTAPMIERASYDGAYKGVTDLLTLYLWRGLAFHLTRWAAMLRMTPNMVTLIGIVLCVATFFLWKTGWYWTGTALGFVFMVLDTVDGKLARTTGTSSSWGNILDHGVDLVHPPFWYWAWGAGLGVYGDPMRADTLWTIIAVILVGYVVQRLVEGAFIKSFGIHIHVWQPLDSRFRLVTARRNPNMVILVAALAIGQPAAGLIAVAWWTALSCLFHLVRLGQAYAARGQGRPVTSWLA